MRSLRFLPENFDSLSTKQQDTLIREGIAELMEAEVIRTRKDSRSGVRNIPPGIISRNLAALSRIAAGPTAKYRDFIRPLRAYYGLALDRSYCIHRSLRDGTLDRGNYQSTCANCTDWRGIYTPETIRGMWAKNTAIAVKHDIDLDPQQFAEMFVDQNLNG